MKNWREQVTVGNYHFQLALACFRGAVSSFFSRSGVRQEQCSHPQSDLRMVTTRRGRDVKAITYCVRCGETLVSDELRLLEKR
jgi:hypothetical protein